MSEHTPGPLNDSAVMPRRISAWLDPLDEGCIEGEWTADADPKALGATAYVREDAAMADNDRLRAVNAELLEALEAFVRRVDAGEVRSKRTYAAFKALIAKAKGDGHA